MEKEVIKNKKFHKVAEGVKPDAKKRVVLPGKVREGVTYYVYENEIGQIVLDPHVSIPEYEAWLFKNPEALNSVMRGLKDAAEGRVRKINPDEL
jgi:hypothetical protein